MPKGKLLKPSQSLFAELQSANTIQSCEVYKRVFSDGYELKDQNEKCHGNEYFSNHVYELQTTITEQREVLMKQIFQVKETEIKQKYSCNSDCKVGCRIFHQKHDWVRSHSEDFIKKLNNLRVNDENRCELRVKAST